MLRACSDTNCYSQWTNNEIYRRGVECKSQNFFKFWAVSKAKCFWEQVCELLEANTDRYIFKHKCKEHKELKNFSGGFVVPLEMCYFRKSVIQRIKSQMRPSTN